MKIAGFVLALLLSSCNSPIVQDSNLRFQTAEAQNKTANNGNVKTNLTANPKKTAAGEKKAMNDTNLNSVSLRAQAENTDAALIVKYEVENSSEQTFYLWDRMIGYAGNQQIIDPNLAYVFYEEPKTVRIMRAVLPLPKAFDIGRKEIPYARLLPPKTKLTGEIKLKHPVKEFSPYYEPLKEENAQLINCSQIHFIIGWTKPRDGMKITERTVGGEKVFAIRGAWESPYQETLEERIPLLVDLLTYTTPFERQFPLR